MLYYCDVWFSCMALWVDTHGLELVYSRSASILMYIIIKLLNRWYCYWTSQVGVVWINGAMRYVNHIDTMIYPGVVDGAISHGAT